MASMLNWAKHMLCLSRQPTFEASHVPAIFRTPHIIRGYRPPHRPWSYYLTSLFQLHNETLNVWTHLIAAVYLTHKLVDTCGTLDCLADHGSWPLLAFGISALTYSLMSAFSHLFSSMSEASYYSLCRLDYVGIGMNAQDSLMLWYFLAGNENFYQHFGQWFVIGSTLAGLVVVACCCMSCSRYPLLPIVSCMGTAVYGMIPLTYRVVSLLLTSHPVSDPLLWRQLTAFPLFALAGFFFSCRMPERLKNGVFDILGNSHSLFHVTISCATLVQFDAALQEYKTRPARLFSMASPTFISAFGGQIVVLVAGVVYTWLSHKSADIHVTHCQSTTTKSGITHHCPHIESTVTTHSKTD